MRYKIIAEEKILNSLFNNFLYKKTYTIENHFCMMNIALYSHPALDYMLYVIEENTKKNSNFRLENAMIQIIELQATTAISWV